MPTVADRVVADIKAGRVLSAKNESELRSAHEALGRVLKVLDSTSDEQKASEPDPLRQADDGSVAIKSTEVDDEIVTELPEELPREATPTPSVDFSAITDAIYGQILAEVE